MMIRPEEWEDIKHTLFSMDIAEDEYTLIFDDATVTLKVIRRERYDSRNRLIVDLSSRLFGEQSNG